jgi:hypothetical protein
MDIAFRSRLTHLGHGCLDRHASLPAVNFARNHSRAGVIVWPKRVPNGGLPQSSRPTS